MTSMDHDLDCMALTQLETALRLYFKQEDYYSVITLAGASEEMFSERLRGQLKTAVRQCFRHEDFYLMITSDHNSKEIVDSLLETFVKNDELCVKILERLQNDEDPEELQGKLRGVHREEAKLLRCLNGTTDKQLKELEEVSGETNDRRKHCLRTLKGIFDSSKSYLDSIVDVASASEWTMFNGKVPRKGLLRAANWLKNMLKHGSFGDTKVVEFDAHEWAKDMLNRAIKNYYSLTHNLTPAMDRFQAMHVRDNAVVRDADDLPTLRERGILP